MFVWFFVTYNLAEEKATYLKCGRFDVACRAGNICVSNGAA